MRELVATSAMVFESRTDLDSPLFDVEADSVRSAGRERQAEFRTGRALARQALRALGADYRVSIRRCANGAPAWPRGIVGSITHCPGYRAAALAFDEDLAAIGIDAEPAKPLPEGIFERIASPFERRHSNRGPGLQSDTALFVAKEAVFKAWSTLTRRRLTWADIEVEFDRNGAFQANVVAPTSQPVVSAYCGRLKTTDNLIVAAVCVEAAARP